MNRTLYDPSHEAFRVKVREFLEAEAVPFYGEWEQAHRPAPEFWRRLGEIGVLGIGVPEEHGGMPGADLKHSAIVTEEIQRLGMQLGGIRIHTDICHHYLSSLGTETQKRRYFPRLASGELVWALAMSEPGVGSDMKAMTTRAQLNADGDHYIVNGQKTFITNGLSAGLFLLACRTDPSGGRRGISLLLVEGDSDGLGRGKGFDKMGQHAQDLAEIFFDDVAVPVEKLLGKVNQGFEYLNSNLPRERLSVAVNSQAAAVSTLARTIEQVQTRAGELSQYEKFELADCQAVVLAGQTLVDTLVELAEAGELALEDAASAKLYCSEMQGRVIERCLKLLGPEAYVADTPTGRAFADARVARIYGGSSEIMKVLVSRGMGVG